MDRDRGYSIRVVTVSHLSAITDYIGFIATQTTYNIARTFASLDHVTPGRIGLNLVTTMAGAAAANFGEKALTSPSKRYGRADEFAKVQISLWDSWEDSALIGVSAIGRPRIS